MSSAQTYALRDIVMLFEEAYKNLVTAKGIVSKENERYIKVLGTRELERVTKGMTEDPLSTSNMLLDSEEFRQMIKVMTDTHTQLHIGMERYKIALQKLEKGAKIEEAKEKAKETKEK